MTGLRYFSAIAALVVLELRMCAASPTSFSAASDNENSFFTTVTEAFTLPDYVDTKQKFVSEEIQNEFEPNERQKQYVFIRDRMHDVSFEPLKNKDVNKNDFEVVSEQEVVEKECSINIEDYLKNSAGTGKELNAFCFKNIKRFSPKDLLKSSIYHEEQRKCNSFLCAWYSEKCDQIMQREHKFNLIDVRIKKTDPVMEKCKCFYRMWNQCGCDGVLSNEKKDVLLISRRRQNDLKMARRDDIGYAKSIGEKFDDTEPIEKDTSYSNEVKNSGEKRDRNIKKADALEAIENEEYPDYNLKSVGKGLKIDEVMDEYSNMNGHKEVKMTKRDNLRASNAELKSVEADYQNDQASETRNADGKSVSINARSGKVDDDEDSIVFFGEEEETTAINKPKSPPAVKSDPFNRESYSDEERNCFVIRAVWFNGQCVELNSVTSCKEGEWLVLERPEDDGGGLLKPVCKPQPCDKPDELFWPSLDRCIKSSEALKTCTGKDQLVKADAFGDGFCTCDDDSGSFEKSESCHKYYQQGSCKINEVVTYDTKTGFAVCSPDLCAKLNNPTAAAARKRRSHVGEMKHHIAKYGETSPEKMNSDHLKISKRDVAQIPRIGTSIDSDVFDIGFKQTDPYKFDDAIVDEANNILSRKRRQSSSRRRRTTTRPTAVVTTKKPPIVKKYYAPMNGTGDCFRLGSAEPCQSTDNDIFFKLDINLHFPRCSKSSLQLFLIDGRPGCKVDETNNCREEVKLAQSSEADYLLSLRKQARRKRSP